MPAPRKRLTTFVVAIAVLIAAPLAVVASDAFDDVSDDNVHHDDITWMADNGVTAGCNPPDNTEFCPEDPVLRQQMASFMRRLAENEIVDAATANEADHATTADSASTADSANDADTVDGMDAEDLESHALFTEIDGFTAIGADTTTEVLSLELPPGTYLIFGRGTINNNAGGEESAGCSLSAGDTSTETSDFNLGSNAQPGDKEAWALTIAVTLDSSEEAAISCTTGAGWTGNVVSPQISAISLQSGAETLSLSGSGGNEDG